MKTKAGGRRGAVPFLQFLKTSQSGECDMLKLCLAIVIAFYTEMSGSVGDCVQWRLFTPILTRLSTCNILVNKLMKRG